MDRAFCMTDRIGDQLADHQLGDECRRFEPSHRELSLERTACGGDVRLPHDLVLLQADWYRTYDALPSPSPVRTTFLRRRL
ncbi:hypothetical protein ADL00_02950 [Streptomyces sp. AS58]|nr:hypothetical protein ADL00_02950 [Streptomyces sp. AS58]